MKNYLVAALALLSVSLFTGCSKNDDNVATPAPTLTGKWKGVKDESYLNNTLANTENFVEDNNSCPDYIEFKSNGSYEVIEKDGDCVATVDDSGTYTFNGSILILDYTGSGSTTVKVTKLTDTELVFEASETLSNGTVKKEVEYYSKL
jgi:hypothetical protein